MKIKQMIEEGEQVCYADIPSNILVYDIMCTGNAGRSPLAEAIARDKIEELDLDNRVLAISSGTNREVMEGQVPPLKLQYLVLERALARNDELRIYTNNEITHIKNLLDNWQQTVMDYNQCKETHDLLRDYESRARKVFTEQEETFRTRVADEIQLRTPIKKEGQQTQAHPQVRWCRALAASNEKIVREIYILTDFHPDITNFGIENTFGLPFEQYRKMAYELKEKIEKDIEEVRK